MAEKKRKNWDEDSTEIQEYMAINLDDEEEWVEESTEMIINRKLSDAEEFMATNLVDKEELDEEKSTENENSTATILYTQRVGGWYKIKSLL